MHFLFIHQNFPGQFQYVAPALAADSTHDVRAFILAQNTVAHWNGVRLLPYAVPRGSTPGIHPWVADLETKTIRAEAMFRAALALRQQGYRPDVIVAHPGWGESLFVKDVWPSAVLGLYCEFYYHAVGADVGYDPEFASSDPGEACRIRMKNINWELHFPVAAAGIAPTRWQASTFPEPFRSKITVVHDGIDTTRLVPNKHIQVTLNKNFVLTKQDQVVTFVNRNLEPCRGFHVFMRSLPALLQKNKKAIILIIGGTDVSYGVKPENADSWKDVFANEVREKIAPADWRRVFFLGKLPYEQFVAILQLSTVHVYLTYPFILSWSLLEAMSIGCAIVASDTQPLQEVISDKETGKLVDFFDHENLANEICALLANPELRKKLGKAARAFAVAHYDLKRICLPRQLQWIDSLR